MDSPRKTPSSLVRSLFERRLDPYAGADLAVSRRFTAGVLGLSSLLALAFLPFEPVDDELGSIGWLAAVLLGAGGLAGAVVLARRSPSFDDLLVVAYTGLAGIAGLNFLAGGGSSAFEDLLVLWLAAGAPHPPRRAFAFLGAMLAALALPLLYEGGDSAMLSDMAAEALILVTIGSLLTVFLAYVRRQRVGLEAGAAVERRLARVDPLTGLGNRRAFDEMLTVEIARSLRQHRPLSVGLVDVDNLKRINDRHGHIEGDRRLRDVARALEEAVRGSGVCFRWGGDEFVVVLPETDRKDADLALGRMAERVAQLCEVGDAPAVELTWGAAELEPGASAEDVLAAADVALLERKTEKRR